MLTPDEIADILDAARYGETSELTQALSALSKAHNCGVDLILLNATDESTGNNVFHMMVANGHFGISTHHPLQKNKKVRQ
jgi:cellobiose-specific phosphotransferase system component IIA